MKYKLGFEMVPDSCWYSNLRSILSAEQWNAVRRDAYSRAEGKCMICGAPSERLEAHERWSYDEENCIQKLETVIAEAHRRRNKVSEWKLDLSWLKRFT